MVILIIVLLLIGIAVFLTMSGNNGGSTLGENRDSKLGNNGDSEEEIRERISNTKRMQQVEKVLVDEQALINAPIVAYAPAPHMYGIPVTCIENRSKRQIVFITCSVYLSDRRHSPGNQIQISTQSYDTNEVFIPAMTGDFYVIGQMSQAIKNYCMIDLIYNRSLRSVSSEINTLRKATESNQYIKEANLPLQGISVDRIKDLITTGESLGGKYSKFIIDILIAHRSIGFDVSNFPDISDMTIKLEREYIDFESQYKAFAMEINLCPEFNVACPKFQDGHFSRMDPDGVSRYLFN